MSKRINEQPTTEKTDRWKGDKMTRQDYKKPGILIRDNDCWEWTGTLNEKGYGRITKDHVHMPATHYVWEKFRGPVPAGHELHHLCKLRSCVNPEHLECLPIAPHRALDAEKRRSKFSPEQREGIAKARWCKSAKQQYYKNKEKGLRRAKRKMPDGSYVDLWVPKTAGQTAVLETCLDHWKTKNGSELD